MMNKKTCKIYVSKILSIMHILLVISIPNHFKKYIWKKHENCFKISVSCKDTICQKYMPYTLTKIGCVRAMLLCIFVQLKSKQRMSLTLLTLDLISEISKSEPYILQRKSKR